MATPGSSKPPLRVLFVCTGNSARSQMAEALLRSLGDGAFAAFSAGTHPKDVHPLTIRALAEVGLDISGASSKSVEGFRAQSFDYVVTVCDRAKEACPVFPGAAMSLHWDFDDPAEATGTVEQRLQAFRRARDLITAELRAFVLDARAG